MKSAVKYFSALCKCLYSLRVLTFLWAVSGPRLEMLHHCYIGAGVCYFLFRSKFGVWNCFLFGQGDATLNVSRFMRKEFILINSQTNINHRYFAFFFQYFYNIIIILLLLYYYKFLYLIFVSFSCALLCYVLSSIWRFKHQSHHSCKCGVLSIFSLILVTIRLTVWLTQFLSTVYKNKLTMHPTAWPVK